MVRSTFYFKNLVSIIIGLLLISDYWKFGSDLREFGTKPVLGVLFVIFIFSILHQRKFFINVKSLAIFLSIFFITFFWVFKLGSVVLNQSFLFFSVSFFVLFGVGRFLNYKLILDVLFISHLLVFSIDLLFDISIFQSIVNDVYNPNLNPRGLYTEHSWSCLILGLSPLVFQNKKLIFWFIFCYTFYINGFYIISGSGILSSFVCVFLFLSKSSVNSPIPFKKLFLPLTATVIILLVGFSTRFSVTHNESNATRMLIPFYLIPSGFENFGFGVGLAGQVEYLIKYHFSSLAFLSEFQNVAYSNNLNRFNSFNLYIRLWSSFGIFGLFLSYLILKRIFFYLRFPNQALRSLAALALLISFSNDSFNNSFLILLLSIDGKQFSA